MVTRQGGETFYVPSGSYSSVSSLFCSMRCIPEPVVSFVDLNSFYWEIYVRIFGVSFLVQAWLVDYQA